MKKIIAFLSLLMPMTILGADSKVSDLTEDTSPTSDDLLYTVDDPGGTPASRKVTAANLLNSATNFLTISSASATYPPVGPTIEEADISDLTHTTDTGPSPDCSGTSTYQDGEGGCDAVGGDISGGLDAVVVANDSHDHTGTTLSGVDISDDTNLAVDAPITLTGDTVGIDKSSATLLGPTITESEISDLSHTTDTGPSPDCSGTTTYQDGEGNCDDISSVYAPISGSSNYIQNRDTLQTGATFYTSSGTVNTFNIGTSITWPDGTVQVSSPSVAGGGTPGGNPNTVQFNQGGSFAGDDNLTYSPIDDILISSSTQTKARLRFTQSNAVWSDPQQIEFFYGPDGSESKSAGFGFRSPNDTEIVISDGSEAPQVTVPVGANIDGGQVRIYDDAANNYIALVSPPVYTQDLVMVLPTTATSVGHVLEVSQITSSSVTLVFATDDTSAGGGDNLGNHTATETLKMAGFEITQVSTISAQSGRSDIHISTVTSILGPGTGLFDVYDLKVGDTTTPDYGGIQLGNSGIYRTNQTQGGSLDWGGAMILRNEGNLDAGNDPGIEFALLEQGNTARLAIPESGSGNATAMIRSVTIAGPWAADNDIVTCSYHGFNNLDCDTGATGADLGVQDDVEIGGQVYVGTVTARTGQVELRITTDTVITGNLNPSGGITDDSIATADIGAGTLDTDVIASSVGVNTVGLGQLSATGGPTSSKFLRGDNTWASPVKNAILKVSSNTATFSTGDGQACFVIPIELTGMDLVTVGGHVYTASSSGLPTFMIRNQTDTADMLSTAITIDANEKDSSTAATAAVINTATDDVVTGDEICIDVDGAGTGAKGAEVRLGFQLP